MPCQRHGRTANDQGAQFAPRIKSRHSDQNLTRMGAENPASMRAFFIFVKDYAMHEKAFKTFLSFHM
jgi:hypothetical protein